MSVEQIREFLPLHQQQAGEDKEQKRRIEAAKKFEAIFIRQLFSIMERCMGGGKMFGSGFSGKIFKDLFIDKVAEQSALGKGMGIADLILRYWNRDLTDKTLRNVDDNSLMRFQILNQINRLSLEQNDE